MDKCCCSIKSKLIYSFPGADNNGIGHCSVIVLAGTFAEVVQRYLNWNEKSKGTVLVKKI